MIFLVVHPDQNQTIELIEWKTNHNIDSQIVGCSLVKTYVVYVFVFGRRYRAKKDIESIPIYILGLIPICIYFSPRGYVLQGEIF